MAGMMWVGKRVWPKYDGLCVYVQQDIKLRKICLIVTCTKVPLICMVVMLQTTP